MTALQLAFPGAVHGVTVEVRRVRGRLRVVPLGAGLLPWFVAFPHALRIEGAQFIVERLRPVTKYYRASGQIARVAVRIPDSELETQHTAAGQPASAEPHREGPACPRT